MSKDSLDDPSLNADQLTSALQQVKLADITEFLIDREADPACPSCRANAWTVMDPTIQGVVDLRMRAPWTITESFGPGAALPAIVMVCNQCGFIRQHSGHLVAAWMLKKLA